ncbi:MAG: PepSY-associated TM helix domain-containing protein [Steroidobacteraceae bacterium]
MQNTISDKPKRRHAWVLIHRYVGLFLAFFLIIAGITGTAIAFYKELDRALNPELFNIVERSTAPLNADQLADKVQQAYPHALITQLMLDRAPGQSVQVFLRTTTDPVSGTAYPLQHTHLFVDPFDGRLLGGRDRGVFHTDRAHFMPFIYKVHYTLYLPGNWGTWFMGIVALIWMFDCFVGFYITLPPTKHSKTTPSKTWWQRWRPAWQIKRNASRTRLNFDLHRASGLWLWIVLFTLAMSGVYFNLKFELFRPVLGAMAELTPDFQRSLPNLPQANAPVTLTFEQALARGRAVLAPELQYMVPSYVGYTSEAPGLLKVRFADPGRGDDNWRFHYENLFLDGQTGELITRVGYSNGTAADKFVMWQYPLHSGQVFGFWGRAFMGLVGLATTLLSITGIIIWLKKRRAEVLRSAGITSPNTLAFNSEARLIQ